MRMSREYVTSSFYTFNAVLQTQLSSPSCIPPIRLQHQPRISYKSFTITAKSQSGTHFPKCGKGPQRHGHPLQNTFNPFLRLCKRALTKRWPRKRQLIRPSWRPSTRLHHRLSLSLWNKTNLFRKWEESLSSFKRVTIYKTFQIHLKVSSRRLHKRMVMISMLTRRDVNSSMKTQDNNHPYSDEDALDMSDSEHLGRPRTCPLFVGPRRAFLTDCAHSFINR